MRPIELTDEEQALIDRYHDFYQSLITGDREPTTDAQRHFVQVAQGKAGAETPHEMAYAKYMRQGAQEREANWLATEARRESEPAPEWFSREDHAKLRGRQYSDWIQRLRDV